MQKKVRQVLSVIAIGMIVCALALFFITENFPQIWETVFNGTATDKFSLTMKPLIVVLVLGRIMPLILVLCALCVVLYVCCDCPKCSFPDSVLRQDKPVRKEEEM